MVILVVFKGFLLVKNLEILVQIVPDSPIYYYCLCDKLRDVPWEDIFKLSASAPASEFCEWFQV